MEQVIKVTDLEQTLDVFATGKVLRETPGGSAGKRVVLDARVGVTTFELDGLVRGEVRCRRTEHTLLKGLE